MHVSAIDHLVINVTDVERSLTWYTEMLGLGAERVGEWRSGAVPFPSVRVNETSIIDLMKIERTGQNVDHFCLVVERADVEAISTDPRFHIVQAPVERWGARGVGRSVYVTDPDDNVVELRSYG